MLKKIYVVEVNTYDFFDYDGRYRYNRKIFFSLLEAFAFYKKEKLYDVEWDDHSQKTRIFHFFVYEDEEVEKQEKRRKILKRAVARKACEQYQEQYQYEVRDISSRGVDEPEYVFDDGSVEF